MRKITEYFKPKARLDACFEDFSLNTFWGERK